MVVKNKSKSGGGKLSRSETVTVRLDPKLRYWAELAARTQRRTLSSYIEWAIQNSLDRVLIEMNVDGGVSIADVEDSLWDVDESDRFVKLAIRYPNMLTHEEQVLWKLIRENGLLWNGKYSNNISGEWVWRVEEDSLNVEYLRDYWEAFKAVANGKAQKDTLPTWIKFC